MEQLNKEQYYSRELDYYLDSENIADCKTQIKINEETTLYALNEESEQFMLSNLTEDVFYIDTSLNEVIKIIIQGIIEANPVNSKGEIMETLEDGRVKIRYNEIINIDDKQYSYNIDWIGFDDNEDGGEWSEAYNIEEI
ncbi:MAG: hypothetical protein ACOC1K_07980 [Nanoarchaeota archaeon]